jgi:preprotein translocase subunit YajC
MLMNVSIVLGEGQASGVAGWLANPLVPMVVVLVIFYVFMIRSKQKTEKQRQAMLNQVKKGDRIQTIGVVLGTVVEARDDEVVVKVDESNNTKVHFTRSAIHRVLEADKTPTK